MTGRHLRHRPETHGSELSGSLAGLAQETHALRQGEFTLRSGTLSAFYMDAITLMLDPRAADLIGQALADHAREAGANLIAGPALGAAPMVAVAVAHAGSRQQDLRGAILREAWKSHGVEGMIAGQIRPGDHALLVDDVLTTGASLKHARGLVEEAGARIVRTVVLLDRNGRSGQARGRVRSLIALADLDDETAGGSFPEKSPHPDKQDDDGITPFQKIRERLESTQGRQEAIAHHAAEVQHLLLIQKIVLQAENRQEPTWKRRHESLQAALDAASAMADYLDEDGEPRAESPNGIRTPQEYTPEHTEHLVMVLLERMEICGLDAHAQVQALRHLLRIAFMMPRGPMPKPAENDSREKDTQ